MQMIPRASGLAKTLRIKNQHVREPKAPLTEHIPPVRMRTGRKNTHSFLSLLSGQMCVSPLLFCGYFLLSGLC